MRIDKYLWCVRVFKTRSLATKACKTNSVKVNDEPIKASREVYPLDKIEVRKNQINYIFEVINHPPSRVGAKLVGLYMVDLTPKEAFEQQDMIKNAQDYYRKKGEGRPTKKDRRELDDWFINTEEE
ncbi:RNA-binding S4 domain-containing protein [Gangjinia marincola]|uniref:RNA-binding S4 domain-containing protein n=1 Tax=Gangjinia marincola TaxID=578463 RepID=A0ABN1MG49_9FLAO